MHTLAFHLLISPVFVTLFLLNYQTRSSTSASFGSLALGKSL
jgi:hypothetical protein